MAETDGRPVPDYDWHIAQGTQTAVEQEPPELWPQFEALAPMPVLAIRGGLSDILSAATLEEMHRRMPDLRSVTLPDRGHVPFLDEPEAVAAIEALLEEADQRCTPILAPSAPPPTA
jgi:pimeloyl-ACP methyl ester carboxylesterase